MLHNLKIQLFILTIFTMGISLYSVDPPREEILVTREITIALNDNLPPFSFRDQQGNLQGMDVDILRLIEEIDPSLQFQLTGGSGTEMLQEAMDHRVDAMMHLDIVEERLESLNFSRSYASYPLAIMTHQSQERVYHYYYFNNRPLAVVENSSFHFFLQRRYPEVNLVPVRDIQQGLLLLANRQVDGFFGLYAPMDYLLKESLLPEIQPSFIHSSPYVGHAHIGLRNDNPELVTSMNQAILAIDSMDIAEIQARWQSWEFMEPQRSSWQIFHLTPQQRQWLSDDRAIILQIPLLGNEFAPHIFQDLQEWNGLIPSLASRFSQTLGKEIYFNVEASYEEALMNMNRPGFENHALQSLIYPGLEQDFLISDPIRKVRFVMLSQEDQEFIDQSSLEGQRIAYFMPSIPEYFNGQGLQADFHYYGDFYRALEDLSKGRIDLILDDHISLGFQWNQSQWPGVSLYYPELASPGLHILFPRDSSTAHQVFQQFFRSMTTAERLEIAKPWLQLAQERERQRDWALIIRWSVLSLIVLTVFLLWNLALRREVQRRRSIEKHFKQLASLSHEGIAFFKKGIIMDGNRQLGELFHCKLQDMLGRPLLDYISPNEQERMIEEIRRSETAQFDITGLRPNGESFMMEVRSRILSGGENPLRAVSFRDITERKLREKELEASKQKLEVLSQTDGLTSLYNRRHFNKLILENLNLAKRSKQRITLAILDVDYFKQYNDHYGHLYGDKALITLAQIVQDLFRRSSDNVFRLGGEEFAVLILGDLQDDRPQWIGERIRHAVESRAIEHSASLCGDLLTVSIGIVSLMASQDLSDSDLYRMSDVALYEAKQQGRNRVVVARETQMSEEFLD